MTSSDIPKKENGLINLTRFIFCFFVIAIHYGPLLNMYPVASRLITECIARIAVPFYFVCTGFFCFQNVDFKYYSMKKPLSTVKHLLSLYLIWSVIYLPLSIEYAISKTDSYFHAFIYFIHHTIIEGSYSHLWYLYASAFAVILLAVLLKYHSFKFIFFISGILYILALFGDSYYCFTLALQKYPYIWSLLSYINNFIITTRNGLQEGLLFVAIGAVFSYSSKLKTLRFKFPLFIISFILMITEYYMIKHFGKLYDSNLYFFLVPCVFFLFSIVISSAKPAKHDFHNLRKLSSLIYLVHVWIIEIILDIFNYICQQRGWIFDGIPSLVIYLSASVASVCVSYLIFFLSKYRPFSFLNKIY